ncbi:hypothetical protein DJ030_06355 [bacterium endosymbiont of Escarpia laminata]|nr:MAG: hypothetical protein DJ030_06355 [bacterium endosymbiont of Escarpia laminata]
MKNNRPVNNETACGPPMHADEPAVTVLKLDPDEYRHYLEEFDMTEAQQNELLQTLWHIMSAFVDMGWGLDSVQLLPALMEKSAGQDSDNPLTRKDAEKTQAFNQVATEQQRR